MEHAIEQAPQENGHVPAEEVYGLRPRRLEAWYDLPEQETYPGYAVKLWVNPSHRKMEEYASRDEAVYRPTRPLFIIEHNGWADEEGRVYPQPTRVVKPDGTVIDGNWDDFAVALPNHLLALVIDFAYAVGQKPGNFQRKTLTDSV